jgi:long-chain acyl-CoA synthetase
MTRSSPSTLRAVPPDVIANATRGVVRLSRQVEITLSEFQLSVSQFRILDRLSGGSAAGRSLAEWLAVKPPSITALVDGLVARGLVSRTANTADRRRVEHDLTEDGRSLHEAVTTALAGRLSELIVHADDPARGQAMIAALADWNIVLERARDAKHAVAESLKSRAKAQQEAAL